MNDFERLFNRLYPRVKLFAMQLLKHEDEAEDVAQNVFAKLWEMPEKWSEDNLDSYVFVMTRNHVLNVIRYRKIHEIGGVECDDNADATLPSGTGCRRSAVLRRGIAADAPYARPYARTPPSDI